MSIQHIRDTFTNHANSADAAKAMRCVAARLSYCDADGAGNTFRDHQKVELDVVRPSDNSAKTITLVIKCGDDIHAAVGAAARKEIA